MEGNIEMVFGWRWGQERKSLMGWRLSSEVELKRKTFLQWELIEKHRNSKSSSSGIGKKGSQHEHPRLKPSLYHKMTVWDPPSKKIKEMMMTLLLHNPSIYLSSYTHCWAEARKKFAKRIMSGKQLEHKEIMYYKRYSFKIDILCAGGKISPSFSSRYSHWHSNGRSQQENFLSYEQG